MAMRTAGFPVCLLASLLSARIAGQLACWLSSRMDDTQDRHMAILQSFKPAIFNAYHYASMIVCHPSGWPLRYPASNLARQLSGHTACLPSGFPAIPLACQQAFLPS
jgi:hypothetical protein